MANNSLANGLKTLFIVLGAVMVATLIYTICTDGLPFRKELLTPWMAATLIDFYINVITLAVWIMYKEPNWFTSSVWIVLLICFGSITTCAYIVLQLMKLSSQESSQDPLYYVLLQHPNKDGTEPKKKHSLVVPLRILFSALGCLMLGTLVFILFTDGSPFRIELFTPWMIATLIDFYINVVSLAVWVAYKESSWISAIFWVILLICFGSITTCVYIVWQLFQMTSQDPTYLILMRHNNRYNLCSGPT
ncbi:putative Transmembrane protein [Quillaja saponaria]|uniref:Transmembrane protein n=1 Tax=Quillaja saponaria TaxID=32244 RepID=A0AAD7VFQ0_QUISA|nr:putative Transmembrane protein [Quillaja saponaria]